MASRAAPRVSYAAIQPAAITLGPGWPERKPREPAQARGALGFRLGRRSPGARGRTGSSRRGAAGAGTGSEEPVKGVDTGSVTIAPVDSQTVSADQSDGYRPDVRGHHGRVEEGAAADLLDTGGAGTGQAEPAGWVESLVPTLVPLDPETVILPVDGVWNGVHGEGYWLLAIGLAKTRNPPIIGGFLTPEQAKDQ
jgi:hypothetical protein